MCMTAHPVDQRFDSLLDVSRRRVEAGGDLADDFIDELVMRECLAILHDAHNASLGGIVVKY